MSKKIIILNGSPRKNGNTAALTAALARGAECDPDYNTPVKQSVLIMAAEGHGFEESELWYDHLEKHIGWKSLGKVLCGWVTQPGDIEGKPELQQAYELGRSIK